MKHAAKIGAIGYALWSILHIFLGITRLGERASEGLLSEAAGRLAQGHWTLIYIGIFGLILSWYNWKNNRAAYWIALFVISAEDIGYILFPLIYGGGSAIAGPVLWLIGLVFTTIAYRHQTVGQNA